MKILIGIVICILMCGLIGGCHNGGQLELYLTDGNQQPITHIDNFYLQSITKKSKPISLGTAKNTNGKFVFTGIVPDSYFGMAEITKGGMKYYLSIDSMPIKQGNNTFRDTLYLGSTILPQPAD